MRAKLTPPTLLVAWIIGGVVALGIYYLAWVIWVIAR